jgi:hypothetical protein
MAPHLSGGRSGFPAGLTGPGIPVIAVANGGKLASLTVPFFVHAGARTPSRAPILSFQL